MSARSRMDVRFLRWPHAADLAPPAYQSAGAAGLDLVAAIDDPINLAPGSRVLVSSGFSVELPSTLEAQVRPRSGLALKHGVTVLNAPGTIDSDYRGEIKVLLINHGSESLHIERGDRIAQLVIAPVVRAEVTLVDKLADSDRGGAGFGSTGTKGRSAAETR
ncbi:MAG: dUTP diphosphatase [Hyphomicrobiales bacterium]|nr:dUTP diphosphatase [Hyphomicrobiales bacterium]